MSVRKPNREKDSVVYAIRCKENGKVYIGCTSRIFERIDRHFSDLRLGRKMLKGKPDSFQLDYNRFGECVFEVYIIESGVKWDDRAERENHWIDYYDATNPAYGYNRYESKKKRVNRLAFINGLPPKID